MKLNPTMTPNPDNASNGYVNTGYVGSSTDLTTLDIGGLPSNGALTVLDLNANQICLTEFRKISDEKDHDDDDLEKAKQLALKESPLPVKECHAPKEIVYEVQTAWAVLRQMMVPFVIAGFGSVFAGIVLNMVTQWPVFVAVPQLEIMVPAFLGLIGNIETTLASRLSTHANLGTLDTWSGLKEIMFGNMLVVQCQASTVGLFAALASLAMSSIKKRTREAITLDNALMLASGSVVTSIIANSLLATVISIVIILARKFRINPDNISTPVAASMGDVCSIAILAFIMQHLFDWRNRILQIALILGFISIAPIFGYFARQNRFTKSVIYTGWSAILGAVIVEQPGGMVMQSAFEKYKVLSTFQPLVNGIGSNLVGIQTSRMSTFLHSVSKKGELPESNPRYCVGPFWVFLSSDTNAKMARLLMLVVVPSHLFYMAFIYLMQYKFDFSIVITGAFLGSYSLAVILQLAVLLYLAYVSVFWAWKHKINPDNSAIPFTSALADVLGNCLMAAAFTFLKAVDDPNANILDLGDESAANSTLTTLANSTLTTMATLVNVTRLG